MRGTRMEARAAAVAAAIVLWLPGSALAGSSVYVDADTGDDLAPCTLAEPCATIQRGIDVSSSGGTVHVDQGTYPLGLSLDDGVSLVADNFVSGGGGRPSINAGGFTAIDVDSSGAGEVRGFDITATTSTVIDVEGPLSLNGNDILVPGNGAVGIAVAPGATDAVTINDNDLFGDDTSEQRAMDVIGGDVTISNNRIGSALNGFKDGVIVQGGTDATITGNEFRAFHQSGMFVGQPLLVQNATATITGNLIADSGGGTVIPIQFIETASAPVTGGDLHRNIVYGQDLGTGIRVSDTDGAVSLDGDLISGFSVGLDAVDGGGDSETAADVSVTGATIFGNPIDISIENADLVLDSSIVGSEIDTAGLDPVTCAITFSRGPVTNPGGDGCENFQTAADPMFVLADPPFGNPDLHLAPGSPMIDAGNPAAAPLGTLDIDGDPRLLDGDGECPEEVARDIGADEFGEALDCDPPQTRIRGPKRTTRERVRFRLRSDEKGSTFRCKLDRGKYRKCKSRYRTPRLDRGRHKLRAKAIDDAGNEDPTPAVKRFRVLPPK